jgi:2Fe-2S ferredoxin
MEKNDPAGEFIFFGDKNQPLEIKSAATSVLEIALENGIDLNHSCGGMGSCGTCRVIIESDPSILPARNEIEAEMAEARGFDLTERLACQLAAIPGTVFRSPEDS